MQKKRQGDYNPCQNIWHKVGNTVKLNKASKM